MLRGGTSRYPEKYETLKEARTEKKINVKTGRVAQHFKCALCNNEFPAKDIQVDHKIPVVGPEGFISWDLFIERLYCEKDNFQVVCRPCHKEKSVLEGQQRRVSKAKNKTGE